MVVDVLGRFTEVRVYISSYKCSTLELGLRRLDFEAKSMEVFFLYVIILFVSNVNP